MNTITPFLFGESTIRTSTHENGSPLFCSKDVCMVLGLDNNRQAVASLEDDEKASVIISDTSSSSRNSISMIFVNEPGLYRLIFKSRKAEALAFQRWVFHDVLPTIRKKGYYSRRGEQIISFAKELIAIGLSPKDAAILTRSEFPPLTRHEQRIEELKTLNEQTGAGFAPLDSESLLFLSIMKPGQSYTIADYKAVLPARHPLAKGSGPAVNSRIGKLLQVLVGTGKIVKSQGSRIISYTLAESQEKIVPMEL